MQEVAFLEVPRNYRHDVVAVSDLPRLVHAQAPVTVPVQGEAHVGLHAGRKLGEAPRMGRAALEVDVIAVRLRAYRLDLCTEAFECEGACLLYTSDAADDLLCVALAGRRIIQTKN